MKATLEIPAPMVAYSHWYSVEPRELAQFVLDEHGRECAELLLKPEQTNLREEEESAWLN